MKLLKVGKIVNTFGIKGELKVLSDSEFVDERFKVNNVLYIDEKTPLTISGFRIHKGNVLIKVNDIDDINDVEKYKNFDLFINLDELDHLEDGYYLFQLEDLDVYENDVKIGKVIEVFKPAQTILRIELEEREILVPFVDAFVESVDLTQNRINITMIEGL